MTAEKETALKRKWDNVVHPSSSATYSDSKRPKNASGTPEEKGIEFAHTLLTNAIKRYKVRKSRKSVLESTKTWAQPLDIAECTAKNLKKRFRQFTFPENPICVEDIYGRERPDGCDPDFKIHAGVILQAYPDLIPPSIQWFIPNFVRTIAGFYKRFHAPGTELLSEADMLWMQIVILYNLQACIFPKNSMLYRTLLKNYFIRCGMPEKHAWIYSGNMIDHGIHAPNSTVNRIVHDVSLLIRIMCYKTYSPSNSPMSCTDALYLHTHFQNAGSTIPHEKSCFQKLLHCVNHPGNNIDHLELLLGHFFMTALPKTEWNPAGLRACDPPAADLRRQLYDKLTIVMKKHRPWLHHTTTQDALLAMLYGDSTLMGSNERTRNSVSVSVHTPSVGGVDPMVFFGMIFSHQAVTFPAPAVPFFLKYPENVTILIPLDRLEKHDPEILKNMVVSQHLASYQSEQTHSTQGAGENAVFAGAEIWWVKSTDRSFHTEDLFIRSDRKTFVHSTTPAESTVCGWHNIEEICILDIALWLASLGEDHSLTKRILESTEDSPDIVNLFNFFHRHDRSEIKIPDSVPLNISGVVLLFSEEPEPSLKEAITQKWPGVVIQTRKEAALYMYEAASCGDIKRLEEGIQKGYPLDGDFYHLTNTPYPMKGAIENSQDNTIRFLIEKGAHPGCFKAGQFAGRNIYSVHSLHFMDMMVLDQAVDQHPDMKAVLQSQHFNPTIYDLKIQSAETFDFIIDRAIRQCRGDVVDVLMQHCANMPDERWIYLYNMAAKCGNIHIIQKIAHKNPRGRSLSDEALQRSLWRHQIWPMTEHFQQGMNRNDLEKIWYYSMQAGSLRAILRLPPNVIPQNALHVAASYNYPHITDYLYHRNPDALNQKDSEGKTPIAIAIHNTTWRNVRLLCRLGCKVSKKEADEILLMANSAHDGEFIDYFIEQCRTRDSLKTLMKDPLEPLYYATIFGRMERIKQYVEKEGMDISLFSQKHTANSLLQLAILANFPAIARYLAEHMPDGDLNTVNIYNQTALHMAVDANDLGLAYYLIKTRGADPLCYDEENETPLSLAIAGKWPQSIIREMVDKIDPFHLFNVLIKASDELTLQTLIDSGAYNPKIHDADGNSLLHIAASMEYISDDMLVFLDKYIDNINEPNRMGQTALDVAMSCKSSSIETLTALGGISATVSIRTPDTELDEAICHAHMRNNIDLLTSPYP